MENIAKACLEFYIFLYAWFLKYEYSSNINNGFSRNYWQVKIVLETFLDERSDPF